MLNLLCNKILRSSLNIFFAYLKSNSIGDREIMKSVHPDQARPFQKTRPTFFSGSPKYFVNACLDMKGVASSETPLSSRATTMPALVSREQASTARQHLMSQCTATELQPTFLSSQAKVRQFESSFPSTWVISHRVFVCI